MKEGEHLHDRHFYNDHYAHLTRSPQLRQSTHPSRVQPQNQRNHGKLHQKSFQAIFGNHSFHSKSSPQRMGRSGQLEVKLRSLVNAFWHVQQYPQRQSLEWLQQRSIKRSNASGYNHDQQLKLRLHEKSFVHRQSNNQQRSRQLRKWQSQSEFY